MNESLRRDTRASLDACRWVLTAAVVVISATSGCATSDPELMAEEVHEDGASESIPVTHAGPANRLQHETSPYLLLHAHNPVDWYPWGAEAFERARREDKPIFLSVGYSTCYWCHVMERRVFADPEIAAVMNRWYINIKVDREERPDIDQIYMTATHLMNRHGGWPMSVFLTPDLLPFFAGTYFPPQDDHGRPGFVRVLNSLNEYWTQRRAEVDEVAQQVTDRIRQIHSEDAALAAVDPDSTMIKRAVDTMKQQYDSANGGFGGAPKFPPTMRLELLLDAWESWNDEQALRIVTHTLDAMAAGGIHDQIGGGFHRYSTDAQWLVPHFEKMLYNQAQQARTYLRAYELVRTPRWRRVAENVLRYVAREMTAPEGGFYSALDAETDAVEGKYYVWTESEIRQQLGQQAGRFLELFRLAPVPEVEGAGVIHIAGSYAQAAATLDLDDGNFEEARRVLYRSRSERRYPLLDDKIITAWNGMMIATCAEAFRILGHEPYRRAAERAASFAAEHLVTDQGALKRVYRASAAKHDGYLEDYAYLADGLLVLYAATGTRRWLDLATAIVDQMVARFWDPEVGGFYYSQEGGDDLIVRVKKATDSALPSANAVATRCLITLASHSGREDLRSKASQTLRAFGGVMARQPSAYTSMIGAAWDLLDPSQAHAHDTARQSRVELPSPGMAQTVAPPDSIVRVAAVLSMDQVAPGETFQAFVDVRIAEGWHLNANPASEHWLIPTSLTVNSLDLPLEVQGVRYPEPKRLHVAGTEDSLDVYDGTVRLVSTMQLSSKAPVGQDGIVRLIIQYQACDDGGICLQPAEWVGVISVRVTKRIGGGR